MTPAGLVLPVAGLLALSAPALRAQSAREVPVPAHVEFRGLHAVSRRVVWASGSGGVVMHTEDGGRRWRVDTIPGAGHLFLTDVWAADARRATAVGTDFNGGRAAIYATSDGGRNWRKEWELVDPKVFLDAVTFWPDGRGLALGDPMAGRYTILVRAPGDSAWAAEEGPAADSGIAAFAASGTALTSRGARRAWFGTGGGTHAAVYSTGDEGRTWTRTDTGLPASASAGIFGVAFENDSVGLAVGGDYQQPGDSGRNVLRTADGGATWTVIGRTTPIGVKWGLTNVGPGTYIATAPTGSGLTRDGGATWTALDPKPANTASCAGGACWLAGKERLARIEF
ncbi:MAG TPA: hypothetical protein VFS28_02510 [Gemmatimonadales bacterium]|nr:hypothetical protein [Gemmatimonadales bacterium]